MQLGRGGLSGADFDQGPCLYAHRAEEDGLLVMEWESCFWIFSFVCFPDLLASYRDFCFQIPFRHPCLKPWVPNPANALPRTDVTHSQQQQNLAFSPFRCPLKMSWLSQISWISGARKICAMNGLSGPSQRLSG